MAKYDAETSFSTSIARDDQKIEIEVTAYGDLNGADPEVGHNSDDWQVEKIEATYSETGEKIELDYDEESTIKEEASQKLAEEHENWQANAEEEALESMQDAWEDD